MNVPHEILEAAALLSIVLILLLVGVVYRYRGVREMNQELVKQKEVMFAFVHDVGEVFSERDSVDVEPLLGRALQYALRTTQAGSGAIYIFEPDDKTLRAHALSGGMVPSVLAPIPETEIDLDRPSESVQKRLLRERATSRDALPVQVATSERGLLIADAEIDPRVPTHTHPALHIHSLIGVPMRFRHIPMGALFVFNPVHGEPFTESDLNLVQALADQASVSVHFALLRDELDAKRRLDHDLSIARRIQTSLLPRSIPKVPGLDIAAFNLPANEIGGDYYDVLPVDEDHWGIAIADVSGKGVSGALMMTVCRSVLRAQAPGCAHPAEMLKSLSRVLAPDFGEDMFVTLLYLVYNPRTRELRIARAGHDRPLWDRAATGDQQAVDSAGPAIGMGPPELFEHMIGETSITLSPGDRVTLFTDGITEAAGENDEDFGMDRLKAALTGARGAGAAETLTQVQRQVVQFAGGRGQKDDMTMLCLVAETPA
ncbi:MAG: SpoIIE family protein phosphatase [Kiritimatiellae bacterium]|nr:SpoIIE family protein phosphatase [Kiritimatiellia bacterium]